MEPNMNQPDQPTTGAGPLYPQSPEALQAAQEPVDILGHHADSDDDASEPGSAEDPNRTGEDQAQKNRENDPPA